MVCLLPVNQFDSEFLKKWFDEVMVAHNRVFFVIAVSVDNHVCNRYCYVVSCSTEPRTRVTQAIVPHMPRLTIM